uniref:Peptidase M12B domain-containing protein n=1 Tax=Acrobeloides nanus TaxID=290746 RepID=A0A914CKR9_9BILA
MGVIVMDDHFLMLQTIPERVRDLQEEIHFVYKRQAPLINPLENFSVDDMKPMHVQVELNRDSEEREEFCDVNSIVPLNYSIPPEAKIDSLFIFPQVDPITLEIGLFLDSKLFEHFQREFTRDAEEHLTEYALALINNVHVLYQQPSLSPNLDIVIVRFEMWKKQPAPLETHIHKNGQAQTLLDSFCRHQARINPGTDLTDPGHWDHGVLLTGYDIYHTTTSVAGVAPVARMCDELFACSLVEGLHLGRSFVLAHEMGHNMGMVHDGVQNQCGRSCCLMSAVNGAGKTTWSSCSSREFNAFLLQLDQSGKGNCLRDPAESIASHDHLKDGRPPGQRFTADQQCSYFWGRDYIVEIPNGRAMDDICRILWCGNSGSTISTAHPALEGSWCGEQKWCLEGQCQAWKYGLPPPIIDGGWSDWASSEKLCPITPCQITGSVSLKSQLRTCTEPAPNNGGKICVGSNVRGLLCGNPESNCEGLSRQEFGDRLCTAIKNDPTRPDRQLSGMSFLHLSQPCKIWCHVSDSELIRNKGQFPNGSPCGINQYCVGGICLNLSCENRALVSHNDDCPPAENADKKSISKKFGPWTDWSECSVSCGEHGVQKRSRKCRLPNAECVEKPIEVRDCDPSPPNCGPEYTEWSTWSSCSVTCGIGQERRMRLCSNAKDCNGNLKEERECHMPICPFWQEWEPWSSCSSTCGMGRKKRSRICSTPGKCDGEESQIFPCSEKECVIETWGDWLPCSVSCGIGFQLRERLCDGKLCAESSKQARTCNVQNCFDRPKQFIWTDWSDWSPCSASCGQGVQYKRRKCLVDHCPLLDKDTDEKVCEVAPCSTEPTWTQWSSWSDCHLCNFGETRLRSRKCTIGGVDGISHMANGQCLGPSFETDTCEGQCSANPSFEKKPSSLSISISPPPPPIMPINVHTTSSTTSNQANWLPWQEWASCSVSCGGGFKQRIRECPQGKDCSSDGLSFELGPCNEESCEEVKSSSWGPWSEWGACTSPCGGGRQIRSRKCRAAFIFLCDGYSKEEQACNTQNCNNFGLKTHVVTEEEGSPDGLAPRWSEWSDWSKCSCFTMNQFRRRFCKILDPTIQGFCTGSIVDQRPCRANECVSISGGWSSWSEWSLCSKDCGSSGHQIRNRMCSNPLPSNRGSYCIGYSYDQQPCKPSGECSGRPINGGWSEWTSWSECSEPCANGQKSRTRYCTNPRPSNGGQQCNGSDFELKSCTDPQKCGKSAVDGYWSKWTEWSDCSSPCGFSFKSRHRFCDSPAPQSYGQECFGLAYMTSICRVEKCSKSVDGHWSEWSDWSKCTWNCGTGTRTRTRECTKQKEENGGYPCFGKSSEVQKCLVTSEEEAKICTTTVDNILLLESLEK